MVLSHFNNLLWITSPLTSKIIVAWVLFKVNEILARAWRQTRRGVISSQLPRNTTLSMLLSVPHLVIGYNPLCKLAIQKQLVFPAIPVRIDVLFRYPSTAFSLCT